MKTKICHFSTVHSPNDTRVFYKECSTLVMNDWEVHLIIQDDKDKVRNGVHIHALPITKSRLYRFFILSITTFFKCLKVKAKIYHFHDPELMRVGVWLALCGKKVVYDVHEDYPKQILDKKWLGPRWMRVILAKMTWLYEQFAVLFYKGVVTATEDIKEKFPERKTMVLYNYSSITFMDKIKPASYKRDENKVVVMYAGGLTKIRGIKEVVEAVGTIDQAELWLFGKWESEGFKAECEALEGWKKTKDFGFMPLDEMFSYLQLADIGIGLIHPLPRYLVALPTKGFEYMTYSKAVLLTKGDFWVEVFGDAALFAEYNQKQINLQLKKLVEDHDLRLKLGANGRKMVEENYCWENEYPKLESLYRKILKIKQTD